MKHFPSQLNPWSFKKKKKQTNSKRDTSGNLYTSADDDSDRDGTSQQSNSEQTDKQQLPIVENEYSDRLALRKREEMKSWSVLWKK